ncbi:MAG: hypothetical protein ABI333_01675 [bacterium]
MKSKIVLAVLCVACSSAGCASWFMVGAEPSSAAPAGATRAWTIPSCQLSSGAPIAGPVTQTYYLAGGALYEIGANGSGAKFTNRWNAPGGTYFFAYVRTRHGWAYFIPNDPNTPATRFVYVGGTFSTRDLASGAFQPVGTAAATCTMVPRR